MRFFLMLILLFGSLLKVLYASYGMTGLPLLLIRGRRSLEDEGRDIGRNIKHVREQLRQIQEKYQRTHKQVSYKDQQLLKKLKKQQKQLTEENSSIESQLKKQAEQSYLLITLFLKLLTPFRIIIGFFFLGISLLVATAVTITNLDRFLNSQCGLTCGYVIEKNTLFNPVDSLFVDLSQYFPLILYSLASSSAISSFLPFMELSGWA